MNNTHFDKVSLLITHFNRSASLERLLSTLKKYEISFAEIIVSDGGSNDEHIAYTQKLQAQFSFTLLTTQINKGLGNSINVGHDAAKTPYIIYIQEDFVPKQALGQAIADGFKIMEEEGKWDIVRFYSFPWAQYPYLKPYKKGFFEMNFSLWPWYSNHLKFFNYADHPHLKRKGFLDKFGRYIEVLNGDITEAGMGRSFLRHNGKGLYYKNTDELFEHVNDSVEPGQPRLHKQKTKKLSEIAPIYWLYLKYRLLKETTLFILGK